MPEPAPVNPRRLIALRHGETAHNASGRWQGHFDAELSEVGIAQAEAAAEVLVGRGITHVVSSDLLRARLTGEIVAARLGLALDVDERLREIHVGKWQGLNAAEIEERWPGAIAAVARGEDMRRGETGESVAEVARRMRPAVSEYVEALAPGECVLVVGHGVSSRTMVADLTAMGQDVVWRSLAGLRNCHWAECQEFPHGWRVVAWNVGAAEVPLSTADR